MMLCRWSGISEYHVICMDYIHRYWNLECSHTHPLNVYIAIDMYMYTYVNVYHTLVFLKRNITHIVWNSSKWLPCQLTVMIEPSFFHYFEIWILYNSITFYIYIYIYFLHGIEILYGIHHCLHVNMDVIYTCGLEHGMHGRHSKYFGLFLGFRHSNAPIPSLHHFFLENHQAFHVSGRRYNIFIYIVIQLQCMLYVYTLNVDCVNIMYSTCIFDTLHCVYNVIHWASYIYICLRYMCIEYVLYMHNI